MKSQSNYTPKRIVSLVPSQTELVVELGLESQLVGITKFCVHPERLQKAIAVVGGTKQVNIDKIRALNPHIILCNKEENTLEMVRALRDFVRVEVSDVNSIEEAFKLIAHYGQLFNVAETAQNLIKTIILERECYRMQIGRSAHKVAYFIWNNPFMVAANKTFINSMLEEAGFLNVFEAESRYPEITLDNDHLKKADLILLSSEPFPFKAEHVAEFQDKFPNKKVMIVDGELFS